MKNTVISNVLNDMIGVLNSKQLELLKETLSKAMHRVEIVGNGNTKQQDTKDNEKFLELFLSAKRVEGCSEKTLEYYRNTISKMLEIVAKWVKDIVTDDLRIYLSEYQSKNNSSKVTIDNIRRILSSFFSWLEDEDYILKSPVRRIHKVKSNSTIKETLTDEDLEVLRDTCSNLRNLVIVEMLASTGIRVGEMVLMNIKDINFHERSCIVFGKGNKEREVYFDARTKLHLIQYLEERTDTNKALFVSINAPYTRLTINGIEKIVSKLGKEAEISKVHPHKFRRTLATMAIDKGMPIEQVQKLLGHVKIDTTMNYAMVNQTNVKMAHRKYLG